MTKWRIQLVEIPGNFRVISLDMRNEMLEWGEMEEEVPYACKDVLNIVAVVTTVVPFPGRSHEPANGSNDQECTPNDMV